ncbi:MAG: RES family NAD+ phosphorylase [Gammaproteobacteria bacterium]|nr:RES family NAD+ phosphorylase [Gammaproteobacteria bacterium]
MPVGWRLAAPEFGESVEDMLSGEGPRQYGGRWNSPGLAAVYLGDSLALAAMELLVHLRNIDVLGTYRTLPIYIPDEVVMHIEPAELPPGWESGARTTTRAIGDRWLADGSSVALQVPSAVIASETNFVLNPAHRDMRRLRSGPLSDFRFDPRSGSSSG